MSIRSLAVVSAVLLWQAHLTSQQLLLPGIAEPLFPLLQNHDSPSLFQMPPCGSFMLEEASIDDMQDAMSNGSLSSVQLVLCYLQRTYQTQDYLKTVLQFNPDVLAIASAMDIERSNGTIRGPLHGIPFTVKDNIASADAMDTTAGSLSLLGSIVPRDAHVVAKLRAAGAVLLGKAGCSEWADMRSSNYSEGYSPRGGQVRSAYNLTTNPGGSSSGSAVGVAANTIAFALGTETDGSVINPAERNALVGIKPTVGLTSRAGVVPESEHQDTVGTFGKTMRDAVYALDAIYGIDPRDNYTSAQHSPDGGFTPFLSSKDSLRGATFGLPWESFWIYADAAQQETLVSVIRLIEDAGATVMNGTEILDYETLVSPDGWDWDYGSTRGYPNESEFTVVKVDFYNNIKTYLSELENTEMRSLEDIVAFQFANDGTEGGNPWPLGTPAFYSGQDSFLASLETKGERNETYFQALAFTEGKTRDGIDSALGLLDANKPKLNALLVPPDVGQSYQIAAQAGYPVLTLPAGIHAETGMPYGLALMQTAWREDELVKYGSAIEDLQRTTAGNEVKRTLPNWHGYLEPVIPVRNV